MAGRRNLPTEGQVRIDFSPPKNMMAGIVDALDLRKDLRDFADGLAIIYREAIKRTIKKNFPDSDTIPKAYTVGQDATTGFPFVRQNPSGIASPTTGRQLFEYITPIQSFLQGGDMTQPIAMSAFFTEVPRKTSFKPERSNIRASFTSSGASLEDVKLVPTALVRFAILPWVRENLGTGPGAMALAVSLAHNFIAVGVPRKPIMTGVFNMERLRTGEAAFFSAHSSPVEKRIKTLIDQIQRGRGRKSSVFTPKGTGRRNKNRKINLDLVGVV